MLKLKKSDMKKVNVIKSLKQFEAEECPMIGSKYFQYLLKNNIKYKESINNSNKFEDINVGDYNNIQNYGLRYNNLDAEYNDENIVNEHDIFDTIILNNKNDQESF